MTAPCLPERLILPDRRILGRGGPDDGLSSGGDGGMPAARAALGIRRQTLDGDRGRDDRHGGQIHHTHDDQDRHETDAAESAPNPQPDPVPPGRAAARGKRPAAGRLTALEEQPRLPARELNRSREHHRDSDRDGSQPSKRRGTHLRRYDGGAERVDDGSDHRPHEEVPCAREDREPREGSRRAPVEAPPVDRERRNERGASWRASSRTTWQETPPRACPCLAGHRIHAIDIVSRPTSAWTPTWTPTSRSSPRRSRREENADSYERAIAVGAELGCSWRPFRLRIPSVVVSVVMAHWTLRPLENLLVTAFGSDVEVVVRGFIKSIPRA